MFTKKKTKKNPFVKIFFIFFRVVFLGVLSRGFCPGFCQRVFSCLEGFVRGGFCPSPLLEYICYIRKLNITLNFMFRMYDKKCISVTSHALYPLPPCHTLSHLLGAPRA